MRGRGRVRVRVRVRISVGRLLLPLLLGRVDDAADDLAQRLLRLVRPRRRPRLRLLCLLLLLLRRRGRDQGRVLLLLRLRPLRPWLAWAAELALVGPAGHELLQQEGVLLRLGRGIVQG